jgi:hypothetical protein
MKLIRDTCGECSIFWNAFRYSQSHQKSTTASDSDSDSNINDEYAYDMEASEENVSALTKSFLAGEEYDTEVIIEAAGHHILQSKSMRAPIQSKTKLAIESVIDEKCHINHGRVIVCDFAQNLPLPHFGGEQPGDIYYLSSLTINLFGIIKFSTAPNKLTCYVYKESITRKCSNIVASMTMHYLHNKHWLMKNNDGRSMSIAMDICGGQTKNNNVLHLAPHLVEMGFFRQCEFDFLHPGTHEERL